MAYFAPDLLQWRWMVPGFMAQFLRGEHTSSVLSQQPQPLVLSAQIG